MPIYLCIFILFILCGYNTRKCTVFSQQPLCVCEGLDWFSYLDVHSPADELQSYTDPDDKTKTRICLLVNVASKHVNTTETTCLGLVMAATLTDESLRLNATE